MVVQSKSDIDALLARWIEENPHRPGPGNARLQEYGVAVWAIVGHLIGTDGDAQQTATDYDVPLDAILAAQHYYAQHKAFIDARRAANRARGQSILAT